MQVDISAQALAAQGVRLKVLAQIFPVLRHEAIAPLSNATLAAAMLGHAPEGADAEARQQRCERLAGDLNDMLEDSVSVIRDLDQWFSDNGATLPLATLLKECRKLLFSQLMWSKRRVRWPEDPGMLELPAFSSRYLLMAWLLCLVAWLPEDAEVELDTADPSAWHARFAFAQHAPVLCGTGRARAVRRARHRMAGRRFRLALRAAAADLVLAPQRRPRQ